MSRHGEPGVATVRFEVVEPGSEDARTALAAYFAELDDRFPTGFDPGEAVTVAGDDDPFTPPHGVFVIARTDIGCVGCGGLQHLDAGAGEIKRMWIHPDWRKLGLAKRLLGELEDHARRLGYRRAVLDTNAELTEAMALYESSGYETVERYNDNPYAQRWYAKDL